MGKDSFSKSNTERRSNRAAATKMVPRSAGKPAARASARSAAKPATRKGTPKSVSAKTMVSPLRSRTLPNLAAASHGSAAATDAVWIPTSKVPLLRAKPKLPKHRHTPQLTPPGIFTIASVDYERSSGSSMWASKVTMTFQESNSQPITFTFNSVVDGQIVGALACSPGAMLDVSDNSVAYTIKAGFLASRQANLSATHQQVKFISADTTSNSVSYRDSSLNVFSALLADADATRGLTRTMALASTSSDPSRTTLQEDSMMGAYWLRFLVT